MEIVGDHELTAFLAKLYVDRLIEIRVQGESDLRAESIIDLILLYIEDTNRRVSQNREDDADVLLVAKVLAWECLKRRFVPGAGRVEEAVMAIIYELSTTRKRALELFRYCERRLNLVQGLGGSERFRFCLDPVAEHLAALHLFEKCLIGRSEDLGFSLRIARETRDAASRGFVGALLDCCRFRGSLSDIPYALRKLAGVET